jgi:hypothetical protein
MGKPKLGSRISFGKFISVIHPVINLCHLQKYIFDIVDTLPRFIGSNCPENSLRNIMFLVTMGTSMKSFPNMVTYPVESDDVT